MKTKNLAYVLIFTIAALHILGCNRQNQNSDKNFDEQSNIQIENIKSLKIGFSLPSLREERWNRDKEVIESQAAKNGIEVISLVADNDAAKQMEQCISMIEQGIEILILAPHSATLAAEIAIKAKEKGVKVISYDRLILNADIDFYISFDNIKVGELQGKYLTDNAPKGNYIILSGAPTDNNSKMYKEGALNYINPLVENKQIKIVLENAIEDWNPKEAKKIIQSFLKSNKNNIAAILAPNDLTAGGCIEALAEKKLDSKVFVTGQDAERAAVKRILAGTQSMTVFKDTRILAAKAIEIAKKIANGEQVSTLSNASLNNGKIDVASFLFEPVLVDKNNADTILFQSGYLKYD